MKRKRKIERYCYSVADPICVSLHVNSTRCCTLAGAEMGQSIDEEVER